MPDADLAWIASLGGSALAAGALALLLTFVAERVAPRVRLVAWPLDTRWHRAPVPLLGGVAIVLGTVLPLLRVLARDRSAVVLVVAAAAMAAVGVVDDVRALRPTLKATAQILIGAALLQYGFSLRLTGIPLVDALITLFWLVGITNAFNFLDNMDGLAASIALVAAGFRSAFFVWEGDLQGALLTASFAGAVAGFLVRNFPPAKIFMGDAGSLFLGFFLAAVSLKNQAAAYSRGISAVLIIPVFVLLIPIFDTAFVTVTRALAGISPAVGGRDHTSHRLLAMGLSERSVVVLLSSLATLSGGSAMLSYRIGFAWLVAILAILMLGLVLLGIHLHRVGVVRTDAPPHPGAILKLVSNVEYPRQVFIVVLDVVLVVLAYYTACLLIFGTAVDEYMYLLLRSLPVVVIVQVGLLTLFGLHRSVWRYTGVQDVLRMLKAVVIAEMATIGVLVYAYRFEGFSRAVFVVDAALLILLLGATRSSFRFFGALLRPSVPPGARRVVIYGAGDGGDLVSRELLNNPALARVLVGFIDDDRRKHHTLIHGLPVFGGPDRLPALVREHGVREVIISSAKIADDGLGRFLKTCGDCGVSLSRAGLRLERICEETEG